MSYAYSHDISPAFTNIKNFTNFLNFGEETGRTARRYLITDSRIDAKYIEQIVQSATRINYAQNIDTIHALGALVSMAAQGAKSVKGGNFQIFQKFIEEAGAELRLETKVAGIKKVVDKTGEKVYEVESKGGKKELFDTIILAAPIVSIYCVSAIIMDFVGHPQVSLNLANSLALLFFLASNQHQLQQHPELGGG